MTAWSRSDPRVDSSSLSENSDLSHASPAAPLSLDFNWGPSRDSVEPMVLKMDVVAPGARIFMLASIIRNVVREIACSWIV